MYMTMSMYMYVYMDMSMYMYMLIYICIYIYALATLRYARTIVTTVTTVTTVMHALNLTLDLNLVLTRAFGRMIGVGVANYLPPWVVPVLNASVAGRRKQGQ